MAYFKHVVAALLLAVTSIIVAQPIADAQGTTVVVIDQRKIMRDSRAGKDIQTKMKSIEDQIKRELETTSRSLESEGKSIETRTQGMTPQAVAADATLKGQVESFYKKAGEFNRTRQIRSAELQVTERKAWNEFFKALQPVLQEVVNEKGAQIMLDRSGTVYTNPTLDASDLVISKLDARQPTINVVRERLPAQQQQQ